MNKSEAWFYIEIRKPPGVEWVDHAGNPIDKITLDKKYRDRHKPGFYCVKSFGELDRALGSIPDNPVQSLTDWQVTINSAYSSGDGLFQTPNLFYHLKSVNRDFDLIGCEACLFCTDGIIANEIFKCSVIEVSSASDAAAITFSERIGAPAIPKSSLPVILGDASGEAIYWPVERARDESGQEEIILSETPRISNGELYIYSEKMGEHIKAEFEGASISNDRTKIIFAEDEVVSRLEHEAKPGDKIYMTYRNLMTLQAYSKTNPANLILGEGSNMEIAQIWHIVASIPHPDLHDLFSKVQLGRNSDIAKQKHHAAGAPIRKAQGLKKFKINLEGYPESIVENKSSGSYECGLLICGEPGLFLSQRDGNLRPGRKEDYPTVILYGDTTKEALFYIQFPEIDLPGEAVAKKISYNIFFETENRRYINDGIFIDRTETPLYNNSLLLKPELTSYASDFNNEIVSKIANIQYSETRAISLAIMQFRSSPKPPEGYFRLYALRQNCQIEIPYGDDVKLYTRFADAKKPGLSQGNASFVIPAIESLIEAAKLDKKEYGVEEEGSAGNAKVCAVLINESADFREKLKTLAIASSALIKFDRLGTKLIASSMERNREVKNVINIPAECLLLQNGIYSFSMQTPMKDQVYSGLEISYGKNIATGKYEHKLLVSGNLIEHDGEEATAPIAKDLSGEWDALLGQLSRNARSGINNLKTMENEWLRDREGAERMALNYLSWCCAPLCTAQIKCVKNEHFPGEIDIGKFASLDLPGYPEKMAKTAWMVTAITDDLDSFITTIKLLEAWNMEACAPKRYMLTERDRDYINAEDGRHLMLEDRW